MRIVVFGSESILARLKTLFSEDNIEIIDATVTNRHSPKEAHLQGFDLVVVEGDGEYATTLCKSLRQHLGKVPVALIINKKHADWTKLISADADGYLYSGSGNTEIKARVKAIMRSSCPGVS
jgi:DNA-binding NarL/FixJ family response regulator